MSGQLVASMARLHCLALLSALIATPLAAETPSTAEPWRIRDVAYADPETPLPSVQVGSTARIGFGIFGLKAETKRRKAVTVRDVSAPRHRRAGVGISLKF